jgi:hypothetical protein
MMQSLKAAHQMLRDVAAKRIQSLWRSYSARMKLKVEIHWSMLTELKARKMQGKTAVFKPDILPAPVSHTWLFLKGLLCLLVAPAFLLSMVLLKDVGYYAFLLEMASFFTHEASKAASSVFEALQMIAHW